MSAAPIDLHALDRTFADLRISEKRRVAKLAADIAAVGLRQPVVAVPRAGRFVLIDGYCRVAALELLGHDTVLALRLEMSEHEALLFAYRAEGGRRRAALEEAWLLRELIERFALPQVELAERLGRSPSFVSRRLALVRGLSPQTQAAVREGSLPAHAATTALVPMTRVNAGHVDRLVASLRPLRPSSRDVMALYAAWRAADPDVREKIVDHPALYLQCATVEPEPPPAGPAEGVIRAIQTISGSCHGARKVLRRSELHSLAEDERAAIYRSFREAELAFASVRERLAEEGLDAR